jgi:hypothetical protein
MFCSRMNEFFIGYFGFWSIWLTHYCNISKVSQSIVKNNLFKLGKLEYFQILWKSAISHHRNGNPTISNRVVHHPRSRTFSRGSVAHRWPRKWQMMMAGEVPPSGSLDSEGVKELLMAHSTWLSPICSGWFKKDFASLSATAIALPPPSYYWAPRWTRSTLPQWHSSFSDARGTSANKKWHN